MQAVADSSVKLSFSDGRRTRHDVTPVRTWATPGPGSQKTYIHSQVDLQLQFLPISACETFVPKFSAKSPQARSTQHNIRLALQTQSANLYFCAGLLTRDEITPVRTWATPRPVSQKPYIYSQVDLQLQFLPISASETFVPKFSAKSPRGRSTQHISRLALQTQPEISSFQRAADER
jgi:hypothetical protein